MIKNINCVRNRVLSEAYKYIIKYNYYTLHYTLYIAQYALLRHKCYGLLHHNVI